jgi:hypothetical protein
MVRRAAAIVCLVLLGLSLGGCTQCGWIWNDWGSKSCRGGQMPEK